MTKPPQKRGLGRGLSALMADISAQTPDQTPQPERREITVPLEHLVPNPQQPRTDFRREELANLADSIRQKGVIQPLIVRPGSRRTRSRSSPENAAGVPRRWRNSMIFL